MKNNGNTIFESQGAFEITRDNDQFFFKGNSKLGRTVTNFKTSSTLKIDGQKVELGAVEDSGDEVARRDAVIQAFKQAAEEKVQGGKIFKKDDQGIDIFTSNMRTIMDRHNEFAVHAMNDFQGELFNSARQKDNPLVFQDLPKENEDECNDLNMSMDSTSGIVTCKVGHQVKLTRLQEPGKKLGMISVDRIYRYDPEKLDEWKLLSVNVQLDSPEAAREYGPELKQALMQTVFNLDGQKPSIEATVPQEQTQQPSPNQSPKHSEPKTQKVSIWARVLQALVRFAKAIRSLFQGKASKPQSPTVDSMNNNELNASLLSEPSSASPEQSQQQQAENNNENSAGVTKSSDQLVQGAKRRRSHEALDLSQGKKLKRTTPKGRLVTANESAVRVSPEKSIKL